MRAGSSRILPALLLVVAFGGAACGSVPSSSLGTEVSAGSAGVGQDPTTTLAEESSGAYGAPDTTFGITADTGTENTGDTTGKASTTGKGDGSTASATKTEGSDTTPAARPQPVDPDQGSYRLELPSQVVVGSVVDARPSEVRGGEVGLVTRTPEVCRLRAGARYQIETIIAGDCLIDASQGAGGGLAAGPALSRSIEVVKKSGAFTLSAPSEVELDPGGVDTVDAVTFQVSVVVSSGGPVTAAVADGRCTVLSRDGNTWSIEASGGESCTITASQAPTDTHSPASSKTKAVNLIGPLGSFRLEAPQDELVAGGDAVELPIVIAHGGGVVITSASRSCTVDPTTAQRAKVRVTANDTGDCRLRGVQQAGNGYRPGPAVSITVPVTRRQGRFTVAPLTSPVDVGDTFEVTVSVQEGPQPTVTVGPDTICYEDDAIYWAKAAGVCKVTVNQPDTARYAGAERTREVKVEAKVVEKPPPPDPGSLN